MLNIHAPEQLLLLCAYLLGAAQPPQQLRQLRVTHRLARCAQRHMGRQHMHTLGTLTVKPLHRNRVPA
jgi:hypothetical protein